MTHFIMVANEVEQRMRLARCEMTQSVLGGQLGVMGDTIGRGEDYGKLERFTLSISGSNDLAPASCCQVGMGIQHCQSFQLSVRSHKSHFYVKSQVFQCC